MDKFEQLEALRREMNRIAKSLTAAECKHNEAEALEYLLNDIHRLLGRFSQVAPYESRWQHTELKASVQ